MIWKLAPTQTILMVLLGGALLQLVGVDVLGTLVDTISSMVDPTSWFDFGWTLW